MNPIFLINSLYRRLSQAMNSLQRLIRRRRQRRSSYQQRLLLQAMRDLT
jgi:hypothetical protein